MDKTGRCHALAMACFFVLNHMSQFHSLKPVCQSELFGYVLKLLISTAGGRFPRAWLEPPRSLCSLWGLKAHAFPAGVAAFRSNQRYSASN